MRTYAELASEIFSKYSNEFNSNGSLERREQLIYFFHRATRKSDSWWHNDWDLLHVAQCDRLQDWSINLMSDEEFNAVIKRSRTRNERESLITYRQVMKRKHYHLSCSWDLREVA
jgi:hypothetical protein